MYRELLPDESTDRLWTFGMHTDIAHRSVVSVQEQSLVVMVRDLDMVLKLLDSAL